MQKTLLLLALVFSVAIIAQQSKNAPVQRPKTFPLPNSVYNTLRDSCTQLDIVFITGKGGSMSLEGRNVKFFTSFVATRSVDKKPNAPLDGTIMWQIDGRAYQMGNIYFTGDSSGYVTFDRNGKEYVNALTPDGSAFLKTRGGR
jgi:hypothetical protein